jgi:hypothetical protein
MSQVNKINELDIDRYPKKLEIKQHKQRIKKKELMEQNKVMHTNETESWFLS